MKHFGREDYDEGTIVPFGFHWGRLKLIMPALHDHELYIALHLRLKHKTLMAYIAWPAFYIRKKIYLYPRATNWWII